ncbi:MAG: hypothetical protein JNL98_27265 [Bryobacterales bacterium]|nr:hypothetical protein [Bryobacterales bacterium]
MKWMFLTFFVSLLPLMVIQAQTSAAGPASPGAKPSPEGAPKGDAKPGNWSIFALAHPQAQLLLGVDWRRALASPLGPVLLKQVRLGGHPLFGFLESIDNVDRILVSSEGVVEGSRSLLVIGEGRFQLAKVRAMAKADGAVTKRYNDVELLVPPGATNDDLHFALVDSQTIFFGDGYSVKDAIDRWMKPDGQALRNPVAARAAGLMQTHELWAVAQNLAETLPVLGLGQTDLTEQVETLEIGIATGQTMTAHVTIRGATDEAAQSLSTGLPALLQLAAFQFSNQPFLTQVSQRLKVVTEKNYLKMGVTLDSKLLEQSLGELRAAAPAPRRMPTMSAHVANLAQAVAAGEVAPPAAKPVVEATPATATVVTGSAPSQPPVPTLEAAPKTDRRTILIVGEDGVREIPFEGKGDAKSEKKP